MALGQLADHRSFRPDDSALAFDVNERSVSAVGFTSLGTFSRLPLQPLRFPARLFRGNSGKHPHHEYAVIVAKVDSPVTVTN